MAKFNAVGLEEVQERMLARSAAAERAVPKMLQAGAEVMKKAQKDEVLSTFKGKRSTGDLANSIKVSKIKEISGGKRIEIYPDGKDRHGVRNATKAFVLQYGRKNMPARPWFTAANTKAADEVTSEMLRVWEEEQNG